MDISKKYFVLMLFVAQRLAEPEVIAWLSFLWIGPVSFPVHMNF